LFFLNSPATPRVSPGDHLVLALHHRGDVDLRLLHPDPVQLRLVPDLLEQFRRVEQRLAGDAADPQARPAERVLLFHARHRHPELRRADRAHVAAGTAAENHQVECISHGSAHIRL